MEGNFYVSTSSVSIEAKGKLAQAFLGCHEQADVYGKCIEKAHANKELKKDSCVQERTLLRQCMDDNVVRNKLAADAAAAAAKK
jgi:hypothetical protein